MSILKRKIDEKKKQKISKERYKFFKQTKLVSKNDGRFSKSCPLSIKNAPIVDYKNINLLKRYISENHKILSSKITSVSSGKQKKLTKEIKKAKVLGLV